MTIGLAQLIINIIDFLRKKPTLLLFLLMVGCGNYEEVEFKETETSAPEARDESEPESEVESSKSTEAGEISQWKFVEKRKTFTDVVSDTPIGYRLPTRLELLTAFMGGDLEDYTSNVWTSDVSSDRDDYIFFFKLGDGQSFAYPKNSLFGTLYIAEDSDAESHSTQED